MSIARSAGAIVGICLGLYIFSAVIPGAISAINDANTTGWNATQLTLWSVVGIIAIFVSLAALFPDDIL